jgi:hypothetical protein
LNQYQTKKVSLAGNVFSNRARQKKRKAFSLAGNVFSPLQKIKKIPVKKEPVKIETI